MTEEIKLVGFHFVKDSNETIVTFHSNGVIELGEKFKDQPDEAARLFLAAVARQHARLADGWIGKPSGDAGPTVVVDNLSDRIGWEKIGHVFRPFRYVDF